MKRNKSQIMMTTAIKLLNHKIAVSTILLHPQMSVNLGKCSQITFSKHWLFSSTLILLLAAVLDVAK